MWVVPRCSHKQWDVPFLLAQAAGCPIYCKICVGCPTSAHTTSGMSHLLQNTTSSLLVLNKLGQSLCNHSSIGTLKYLDRYHVIRRVASSCQTKDAFLQQNLVKSRKQGCMQGTPAWYSNQHTYKKLVQTFERKGT